MNRLNVSAKAIMILFVFFCFGYSYAQIPRNGLTAYYPFNGNANNQVSNSTHGTVVGATLAMGKDSGSVCYSFDGINDRILIPSNFDYLPRTINLWFNASSAVSYSDWRFIYESDNGNLQYGLLELVLKQDNGQLKLFINAGNCRDTVVVNTNTWYNANLYVDPTKRMKFHLNGVLESNKTFTTFAKSASGSPNVVIGADRLEVQRLFAGKIDDIAVYNRELTQLEIDSIYYSLVPPPPPPPPANIDSLVAFYPFDGNANDISGSNLNGTAVNVTNAPNRGNIPASSYKFNGSNSYVEFPSNFDFVPRTVNLWFKAETDNYSDWKFIYESDNPALQKGLLELVLRETNGQLKLYVNAGSCRDTINVNVNTWYNVNLFVDSNKVMKFYLNGVLKSTKTFTNYLTSGDGINKVILGTDRHKLSRYFKGQIDDVRFYNYDLSQMEIDSIFNILPPPPPPPVTLDSLVAFYPFNGNTLDSSGNNLHATAANIMYAANRFNNASASFKFNGVNSYVELPSNFDFVPRTVNLWFKADADDYSNWKFIYESDNPALQNGLLELVLREEMGQLLLYINAGSCRDTVDVQINTWYNATLYVDSNKIMKFYLNGQLVSNKSFSTFLTSGDGINKVILGTDRHKISRYFKGQIDDVKFYSYELSQQEINNIVNEGLNICHVTVTDTLIINVNLANSSPVVYNNTIKIFPNPTNDKINIDCGSNYTSLQNTSLRITNSLGQAMFESKITQQTFTLDMNKWTGKGLYLVYIVDSKGNITDVKKILLQ